MAGLSRSLDEKLSLAIDAIYDAGVAPGQWPDTLRLIRDCFQTASTAYLVHNADRTRLERVSAEDDPEGQQANVAFLLRGSIAYAQGQKGQPGQIIRVADLLPTRLFQRSEMYETYWRPRHLHDGIRLTIAVGKDGTHHAINLLRPKSVPAFEGGEIALAGALMPHLQRAVALARRLREADLLASAALTALDTLRHAVLLLDQNGRLLHANGSGEAMLREGDPLGVSQGVLFAATSEATRQLHAAVARAVGAVGLSRQAGALRLTRRNGGGAMPLLAIPFRQDTAWSVSSRPEVLVCVSDPTAIWAPPGPELAALFGLTAAETALAADLLAGRDLRDIAKGRGRSINTMRTHLAKLMAKTNVNRQSELMRLLVTLPRSDGPIDFRTRPGAMF